MIGAGAEIGRGSLIGPGTVIGPGVRIGRDVAIGGKRHRHPCPDRQPGGASIPGARLGQDGFGFVPGAAGHMKIAQVGRVIIQDDVEIGANTTIDRGSNRDTIVGEGTKIDNQVQIGHNVVIGRHCLIAGQVGISGSVTIGDFVMLGGHAGIRDNVFIGTGARVAAAAGVHTDIPAGETLGRHAGGPDQGFSEPGQGHATAEREGQRTAGAAPGARRQQGAGRWMKSRPGSRRSTSCSSTSCCRTAIPFLMVDRIIDVDGDNSAVGIKNVTVNEPFFAGHFPGQSGHAGRASGRGHGADGRRHLHRRARRRPAAGRLFHDHRQRQVPQARCSRRPVEYHVKKMRNRSNIWKFCAEAMVSGSKVAEAIISALIADE